MTSAGGQQGSRLDPWLQSYAERTAGMTTSEIRALFAVASRPEIISLAGGMPCLTALPLDAVADTVAHMLRTRAHRPAVRVWTGRSHIARADSGGDGERGDLCAR